MEKIKILLYCTKQPPYLVNERMEISTSIKPLFELTNKKTNNALNGKIVAECDFEVEEIKLTPFLSDKETYINEKELLKNSCLSYRELADYIGGKGYAIHIKNLNIFDKAIEEKNIRYKCHSIKNKVKNIMKVYDYSGTFYYIMPVSSRELDRILSKEQTIVVRKKILKEML